MVPNSVEQLLSTGSESAVREMLADEDNVVLVDWREEDDAIVASCEDILNTGDLAAEVVEVDADPGSRCTSRTAGDASRCPSWPGRRTGTSRFTR